MCSQELTYRHTKAELDEEAKLQPLKAAEAPTDGAEADLHLAYNARALSELTHHMLGAQQLDELKLNYLFTWRFLSARVAAQGLRPVLADLDVAIEFEPSDQDLRLLRDVLEMSDVAAVRAAPGATLASQLVGRTIDLLQNDRPKYLADPVLYPYNHLLSISTTQEVVDTFVPTGGTLFVPIWQRRSAELVALHTAAVTAIGLSLDGQLAASSSADDVTLIWLMRTKAVRATVHEVGARVGALYFSHGDRLLITSERSLVRLWDISRLAAPDASAAGAPVACVAHISDCDDPAAVCVAEDRALLALAYDGIPRLRVWQLEPHVKKALELPLPLPADARAQKLHQDKTILVSSASFNFALVWGFRGAEGASGAAAETETACLYECVRAIAAHVHS